MTRFATDLGRVADELPDALVMLEADRTIAWTNQATVDLMGLEPTEWVGRSVFEILHEDDHGDAVAALDTVRTQAPAPRVDVRIRDGAGGWRRTGFRGRTFPGGADGDEFMVVVVS